MAITFPKYRAVVTATREPIDGGKPMSYKAAKWLAFLEEGARMQIIGDTLFYSPESCREALEACKCNVEVIV